MKPKVPLRLADKRILDSIRKNTANRRADIFLPFLLINNIPENLLACVYFIYICELVQCFKDSNVIPEEQMKSEIYRERGQFMYKSVLYRQSPNVNNFYRLGLHRILEFLNRKSINYYSIDFALYGNQLETLKFLINNGAKIRPYHFYHAINDYNILKYMIDVKGKVKIKKDIIKEALYKKCDIKIIELLINAGVHIVDENIIDAACEAREDIIELLMSKGAKMENRFIDDALNRHGHCDKLKLLVKYGAKIEDHHVLGSRCLKLVDMEFFLNNGIDIGHFNLVRILSVEYNLQIIKFLVDNGAKIGPNEIQFIIENRHHLSEEEIMNIIEYLLSKHIQFPPISIHLTSNKRSIHFLKFLLDKGAVLDTNSILLATTATSGYTNEEIIDVLSLLYSRNINFLIANHIKN